MTSHERPSGTNRFCPLLVGPAYGRWRGQLRVALLLAWVAGLVLPAAVAQNGIKLAWDPNTESSLAGYKVHYGSASGIYTASVDVGNVTSYTLNVVQSGTYYVAVTAYDNLQNESDYSNEVSTTIGSCTYLISPTSRTHGSGPEPGTISVSAGAGCSWTAASSFPWISIVSGAAGSGNGTVAYSVQVNPGSTSRSGTIAVAGQTFLVTQAVAGSCTYGISPTGRTHGSGPESGTISVSAGAGCSWNAASSIPWISIVSGATGSGNGTVSYSVQAAPSSTSRSGIIAVAGLTFLASQGSPGFCDVNRDGQITSEDLQLLVNIVLGKSICPSNCDLNHDAKLDTADLQTLANVILGVTTCR